MTNEEGEGGKGRKKKNQKLRSKIFIAKDPFLLP